jgi:hypothetical protein
MEIYISPPMKPPALDGYAIPPRLMSISLSAKQGRLYQKLHYRQHSL